MTTIEYMTNIMFFLSCCVITIKHVKNRNLIQKSSFYDITLTKTPAEIFHRKLSKLVEKQIFD